jgi:hypothetical protein
MIPKKQNQNGRIDQFIEFFKTLGTGKSSAGQGPDPKEDPAWNQTETQYQEEQARWLAEIDDRKNRKNRT